MILKFLHLHHIRSYIDTQITFKEGSLVLSGDIGSGKSTILLAIEFALFGLSKGDISGNSLLRHGTKDGFVELGFSMGEKEVHIRRTLKRGIKTIAQESGYVAINGVKKSGTPEELKAVILQLLGYPLEFIKKKDLIYRYTVYTPQEEMKQILYEPIELRLDTLRKVFTIDKYKRIVDNTAILVSALREKKRALEGFASDLAFKKSERLKKQQDSIAIQKNMQELLPQLTQIGTQIAATRGRYETLEKQNHELIILRRDISNIDGQIRNYALQMQQTSVQQAKISEDIAQLRGELSQKMPPQTVSFEEQLQKKQDWLKDTETRYRANFKNMQEVQSQLAMITKSIEKIVQLDTCPVCEQKVADEYKQHIHAVHQKTIDELTKKLEWYRAEEKTLDAGILAQKKEIDLLRNQHTKHLLLMQKEKYLAQRSDEQQRLIAFAAEIKTQVGNLTAHKQKLATQCAQLMDVEKQFLEIKTEIDERTRAEQKIAVNMARLETEAALVQKQTAQLAQEIADKENALLAHGGICELLNWTQEFFVKLVLTIEKHVLVHVHTEFDALFREWFSMLIGDESIAVRLDDAFTPEIEQNGYDTALENLSGGEKTAVALAYRLALNKVINEIVSGIQTKDLLMLDEPTDGFSAEQLDNMRSVFAQLAVRQLIIVSHESKIESFAESVVRVTKEGHVSSVSVI